jgi:putative hemolysin
MLVTLLTVFLVTVSMIGFNALYVAGEFAAVSSRKSRIIQLANDGNRFAKMLLPIMEDHHKLDNYIAASQVGITLSSIVLGIYGQQEIAPLIAPLLSKLPFVSEVAAAGIAATLVLILLTTLQVILGELVPKSLALQYPEQVALWTAIPMRWSADFILKPLIILLNGSGALIMRLMGIDHSEGHKHVHSPEEIKFLILQSHEGGLLDEQEHNLLDSALRFRQLQVGEILIPRMRMIAADVKSPVDDVLRIAADEDYTRIPIYEGDIDHIIGFVHLKELFQLSYQGGASDVRGILRDVTFVPEISYLDDVWETLNEQHSYLAIVFDEYGGTVGLITREDLLEELFGEVQDEFDDAEVLALERLSDNEYRIRGEMSITHVNNQLHLNIDTSDAFTIGGFFMNELGRIPQTGDEVTSGNVRLKADVVNEKAIESIILTIEENRTGEKSTLS